MVNDYIILELALNNYLTWNKEWSNANNQKQKLVISKSVLSNHQSGYYSNHLGTILGTQTVLTVQIAFMIFLFIKNTQLLYLEKKALKLGDW